MFEKICLLRKNGELDLSIEYFHNILKIDELSHLLIKKNNEFIKKYKGYKNWKKEYNKFTNKKLNDFLDLANSVNFDTRDVIRLKNKINEEINKFDFFEKLDKQIEDYKKGIKKLERINRNILKNAKDVELRIN